MAEPNLPYSFENSKATPAIATDGSRIETGMIVNVNPGQKTVDWASQYTGKLVAGIQISSPYLHYNSGEGFTVVPDVGALCAVCWPSDGDLPFVLAFITAHERQVEPTGDNGQPQITSSSGSSETPDVPKHSSFNSGRPDLNIGDLYWQGRDGNFIVLRRGGILQLGSTDVCQRLYIPLTNLIRDVCENLEMNTAGGSLTWKVRNFEDDPDGDKQPAKFELVAREYAQDKLASVLVNIGSLDNSESPPHGDKPYVEVVLAPQGIDPVSGEVTKTSVYELRLDKKGNSYQMQAGTRTTEVRGDDNLVVFGTRDTRVKGNDVLSVDGDSRTNINGDHSMVGDGGSSETWAGRKVIEASAVDVGASGASHPAALGDRLIEWLASHTHVGLSPMQVPQSPPVPALLLSSKVKISE